MKIAQLILVFMIFSFNSSAEEFKQYEKEIKNIEDYLNAITTLTAQFIQKSENDEISNGKVYLSRPGKMRWEYLKPAEIIILVSNNKVTYFDKEMDEVSKTKIESTIISFLTKKDISFSQNIKVNKVIKKGALFSISVSDQKIDDEGELLLTFNMQPIKLVKMQTIDADNKAISVEFNEMRLGESIDNKMFKLDREFLKRKF